MKIKEKKKSVAPNKNKEKKDDTDIFGDQKDDDISLRQKNPV